MGGFFGATSLDDVVPMVMDRLSRMEPAGCNSCGVGVLAQRRIQRRRIGGSLSALNHLMADAPAAAPTVIGHVERTTPERSSRRNAQPHASPRAAVVHVGTIENYEALRLDLERQGVHFRSDSESEVIAWLLDRALANRVQPLVALRQVLRRVRGPLALGVMCSGYGDQLYAVQRGRALAVARSERHTCLSSDPDALSPGSTPWMPLRDGDIVELRPHEIRVFDSEVERYPYPRHQPLPLNGETAHREPTQ